MLELGKSVPVVKCFLVCPRYSVLKETEMVFNPGSSFSLMSGHLQVSPNNKLKLKMAWVLFSRYFRLAFNWLWKLKRNNRGNNQDEFLPLCAIGIRSACRISPWYWLGMSWNVAGGSIFCQMSLRSYSLPDLLLHQQWISRVINHERKILSLNSMGPVKSDYRRTDKHISE